MSPKKVGKGLDKGGLIPKKLTIVVRIYIELAICANCCPRDQRLTKDTASITNQIPWRSIVCRIYHHVIFPHYVQCIFWCEALLVHFHLESESKLEAWGLVVLENVHALESTNFGLKSEDATQSSSNAWFEFLIITSQVLMTLFWTWKFRAFCRSFNKKLVTLHRRLVALNSEKLFEAFYLFWQYWGISGR